VLACADPRPPAPPPEKDTGMSYDQAPPPRPPTPPQGNLPYGPPVTYAATPPSHPWAIGSVVLGVLSIVGCGLLVGIPAMVMGRRVIRETRASGGTVGGEGLGQVGFWTGLVGTCLNVVALLALVVLLFAFGGTTSSTFQQSCRVIGQSGQSSHC
jgi:hypothetical protein